MSNKLSVEEITSQIAKKHGLGNQLVTGHKYSYFKEAMLEHTRQALQSLSDDIKENGFARWQDDVWGYMELKVDKDSINTILNNHLKELE